MLFVIYNNIKFKKKKKKKKKKNKNFFNHILYF